MTWSLLKSAKCYFLNFKFKHEFHVRSLLVLSVALTSLMKCDNNHAVTLSMETINGRSEKETLLERVLGTTKVGGPNRRSVSQPQMSN